MITFFLFTEEAQLLKNQVVLNQTGAVDQIWSRHAETAQKRLCLYAETVTLLNLLQELFPYERYLDDRIEKLLYETKSKQPHATVGDPHKVSRLGKPRSPLGHSCFESIDGRHYQLDHIEGLDDQIKVLSLRDRIIAVQHGPIIRMETNGHVTIM